MRRTLVACAAAWLAMLSAVGTAAAEPSGTLLVVPAQGTVDTPVDVVTSGLCSRGVTFVVAVRGDGIDPVTSGNAVGNTELRVLEPSPYPGHHAVPLSRTLREFFTANGIGAPQGNYDLVFACRNRLDATDLQTFAATIRIDKSGAYRALGPAALTLKEFLSVAESQEQSDEGASDPAQTDSSPPAADPASPQPASPGGEVVGDATQQVVPADDASGSQRPASGVGAASELASPDMTETATTTPAPPPDDTWRVALIVLGAVLLSGAAYMAWKARTR